MSAPRTLTLDRLDPGGAVEVVLMDGAGFTSRRPREPHRHDYHELVWVRSGDGEHLIDGRTVPVRPGTVTVIGRGQVHVFQRADAIRGAIVRFGDEVLHGSDAERGAPEWLLAGRGGRSVAVAEHDRDGLEAVVRALASEVERPRTGPPTSSSATCWRSCSSGSSPGTTQRAPSGAMPTTPRSSCIGASRRCSRPSFTATMPPATTPMRFGCRRRPSRRGSRARPGAARRS